MASPTDPPGSEPDFTPETFGAPTEFANAAEAPAWVQSAARLVACLPVALSAVTVALLALCALVGCLVVAAILLL